MLLAKQRRSSRTSLVERLESRLALSTIVPIPAGPQPVYVAPSQTGLAPIELPPVNTLPPGTKQLSTPPAGQLPSGLSPVAGAAEALAVKTAITFQTAHPSATQNVAAATGTNSFSVTVTEQDGAYYFTYLVSETMNRINVGSVEHDTTTNSVLIATENPVQQNGGLAFAQFNQSTLTSLEIVAEIKGVETVYQYPSSTTTASAVRPTAANGVNSPLQPAHIERFLAAIGGQVSEVIDHLTPTQIDRLFTEIGGYLYSGNRSQAESVFLTKVI